MVIHGCPTRSLPGCVTRPASTFVNCIQGHSGGKVSILGGDNFGHCEKESSYERVSNCEWLPRED
jgi:hypothetical protein